MSKNGGRTRGVEHPIAEDAALIGDTRHELHTKSLPKLHGPNYNAVFGGKGDEHRDDTGTGQTMASDC